MNNIPIIIIPIPIPIPIPIDDILCRFFSFPDIEDFLISVIPHFGQVPGWLDCISECIEQV